MRSDELELGLNIYSSIEDKLKSQEIDTKEAIRIIANIFCWLAKKAINEDHREKQKIDEIIKEIKEAINNSKI